MPTNQFLPCSVHCPRPSTERDVTFCYFLLSCGTVTAPLAKNSTNLCSPPPINGESSPRVWTLSVLSLGIKACSQPKRLRPPPCISCFTVKKKEKLKKKKSGWGEVAGSFPLPGLQYERNVQPPPPPAPARLSQLMETGRKSPPPHHHYFFSWSVEIPPLPSALVLKKKKNLIMIKWMQNRPAYTKGYRLTH